MTTYEAYKFLTPKDDEDKPFAIVWWTGKNLKSTDENLLKRLKDQVVDGMDYSSGKPFFDRIPSIYRSGYVYTLDAMVDADGKEV
jgi:hypothetical protein